MLAGGASGKRKIVMQLVRSTDNDRIDIVTREKIFITLEDRPFQYSRDGISGTSTGIRGR